MKGQWKYIAILVGTFALLILIQMRAPRKINWTPTFSGYHKIPYGCYVTRALLPELFPDQSVTVAEKPVPEMIDYLPEERFSYIFINQALPFDSVTVKYLLRIVRAGHTVFAAGEHFGKALADSLKFSLNVDISRWDDSTTINLVAPALAHPRGYRFPPGTGVMYFARLDTPHTTILGMDDQDLPNFVRITLGDGALYLSTVPLAFTNYYLLHRPNGEYAFKALSYLPVQAVVWDEYYKLGREYVRSPLRYVLREPPLKKGFYVGLVGVVLFVLFQGRRRQRIIPIIPPVKNTTLEFVETVGRLYYQNGNHRNLADKKILHFLEFLRSRYYVKTDRLTDELCRQVARKSGMPLEEVKELFRYIRRVQQTPRLSEVELQALHKRLESFYQKIR